LNLREITLEPVAALEERRFQSLMQAHHYLGSLPKIGHTLWYIATWRSQWLALLSFSAAALKCAARDNWIGWDFRHQYDRLHLIANNSRFLILPEHHYPNLASRILSLCERRLAQDWPARFGHPLWLLETFVDGLSAPVGSPRSGPLVLPDTRSRLLSWSSETDVECRTHARPTGLLRRYPRSAPRSGAASPLAGGVGHRHRRCPVWRTRLQGYQRMGR
jgi:hypothetical protein